MKQVKINDIIIGKNGPALVIPEIGINHSGSLDVAKEMALSAFRAGARIIKHQTHVCEDEMCEAAKRVIPGNAQISIYDIMKECALSEEDELEFKKYVETMGMVFLSTPFSRKAAERLERFGVHAYKIGSGELNNYPLLEHVSEYGKPMIVSTGMNDLKSVEKAVEIMERKSVPYALMHTTNMYPTKPEWVRLGAMLELSKAFPGIPIGLSDHTINNNACKAAIALGACVVERHYTDNMRRKGPDIVCSMDEKALRDLLLAAREIPLMRGGKKEPLEEEKVTIDFAFSTVCSIRDIKKGDVFTEDNIWVKRPGTGEIPASKYYDILGMTSTQDIPSDTQIGYGMVR